MAKIGTLEEFIKNHLSNKLATGELMSAGDYAINALGKTSVQKPTADLIYKKSLAGYGSLGDRLAESGLSDSGYAKYLDTDAHLAKSVAKDAERMLAASATEDKTAEGYDSYLQKVIGEAEKLYSKELKALSDAKEKAYKKIINEKIVNYEEAYSRAVALGLEGEDAEEIAKSASEKAKEKLTYQLLEFMVKNQLTYSQAKDFAIGRGLGVEDSEKLAELVKTINQEFATGKTSKTYLDYLREQEEKNKEK